MELPKEIYLDTNIVYRLFDKFAEAVKQNKDLNHIELPNVIRSLKEVKDKHRHLVSIINRAEIFRHLHSAQKLNREECYVVWDFFLGFLQVTEILVKELDFAEISDLLKGQLRKLPS